MKNLIKLTKFKHELRIGSDLISENTKTEYKSTNNLIRKHKSRLESFGELPFKKAVGGRKNIAYLNEDQAIFLMTLSKNTEIVVSFKHNLVKEFSKLRTKQAVIDANHAKIGWQQNRELGKFSHRKETDTTQVFMNYAGAHGSTNYPKHGYSIIAKMINRALNIDDRDAISEDKLHLLSTAEQIVENSLKHGMSENLPYKVIYKQAKNDVNNFSAMMSFSDAA
ncbi:MAG: hypothetical protein QM504_17435 [Pseudomonadota bacterium]